MVKFNSWSISIYWLYLVIAIPSIYYAWMLEFPRGYLSAFIALPLAVLILHYLKDELIEERKIWKEYFIGLSGLMIVPIISYLGSGQVYITMNDLYYLLVGITAFQIGLMPLCVLVGERTRMDKMKHLVATIISMILLLSLTYLLFVVMDIRVVH